MTPTTPPSGQALTAETVKLLVKGDVIWDTLEGAALTIESFTETEIRTNRYGLLTATAGSLTFIGRPDADGWIAWSGGDNPAPGVKVEVRLRDGSGLTAAEQGDYSSEQWEWPHYDGGGDIIAFRLASQSTAPTRGEGEGSEIGEEYDAASQCVTLAECPPGLFFWNGTLGLKSEYGMMEPVEMGKTWTVSDRPDAYCADSGEYFWGGTSSHDDRAKVLVMPVDAMTVAMAASHGFSALRTNPTPPEPVALTAGSAPEPSSTDLGDNEPVASDGEGLVEKINAEMDGRQRGYADVRGELLFRCRDRIVELEAELSQANANGASHWSRATQAEARADRLAKALEPFAAFARVAEAKSRIAVGKVLPDSEILASISWEGGLGVLVMGHFRDALSLAPDAKGWSGLYRRSAALASQPQATGGAVEREAWPETRE